MNFPLFLISLLPRYTHLSLYSPLFFYNLVDVENHWQHQCLIAWIVPKSMLEKLRGGMCAEQQCIVFVDTNLNPEIYHVYMFSLIGS